MRNIDFIKQPWLKFERFILHLCYLATRRYIKSRAYPKYIKKILLIRRNRLGDSINVLPIIEALKKNYPSIKISVLANQYNAEIFSYSNNINKVYCINEKWWLGRVTLYLNPIVRRLRRENFDLVIGLGGYASMLSQISFCIKGKYSVGPKSYEGNFNDLLFDFTVKKIQGKNNLHIDEMANIVRGARLKLPKKMPFPKLNVSVTEKMSWLAICPDVTKLKTEYPIYHYQEIIKALSKNQKIKKIVVLVRNKNNSHIRLAQYGAEIIETRDLHDFIKHLSKCTYAIASEGGAAHIAGALGLSVCVISNIQNQIFWKPYSRNVKVFVSESGVQEIPPEIIINGILSFG
jgi:ADP-heptose:LPS heptosyltransferase